MPNEDVMREAVVAELRGDFAAREICNADTLAWLNGLTALIQDIEAQFSRRGADRELMKVKCLNSGDRRAWFTYEAEHRRWRGSANYLKNRAVQRLRAVRAVRAREVGQDWRGELLDAIRALASSGEPDALAQIAAQIAAYDTRVLTSKGQNGNA